MSTGTVLSGCQLMKRMAKEGRKEIEDEKRRIDLLESQVDALEHIPDTPPSQIEALRTRLRELRERLELDEAQQSALEDEILASCS
ncbi:hypothetical protein OG871_26630 [Kitasatospora sp. NBC_00374]|uniref:hypothetical protein n=1 Tax=Kitasatospora sp. NBC_00374 TaxID=2975964 RepID=UPI003243E6F0